MVELLISLQAEIIQRRGSPGPIVVGLDVEKQVEPVLVAAVIHPMVYQPASQPAEGALHGRVVVPASDAICELSASDCMVAVTSIDHALLRGRCTPSCGTPGGRSAGTAAGSSPPRYRSVTAHVVAGMLTGICAVLPWEGIPLSVPLLQRGLRARCHAIAAAR